MIDAWNAKTYSQFLSLRTRPARDLLSAIANSFQPKLVYDLGCGTGNSTILLKDRWPHAKVVGLDSSLNMLEKARISYPDISFIQGDAAHFSPGEKIDCLFANASLQWLDAHETLIPNLLQHINPEGVVAIQMSNNFHAPSHQVIIRLLQNNQTWQPLLKKLRYGLLTKPLYNLSWYYDLLKISGLSHVEVWETAYFQEMLDYKEIFEWVKGTALLPFFSAMDVENQTQFSDAYIKALANEYPLQASKKVLLPFKRIFMIGYK